MYKIKVIIQRRGPNCIFKEIFQLIRQLFVCVIIDDPRIFKKTYVL